MEGWTQVAQVGKSGSERGIIRSLYRSERHGHKCSAHFSYSNLESNMVITSDERLRYREIFLPPNEDPTYKMGLQKPHL